MELFLSLRNVAIECFRFVRPVKSRTIYKLCETSLLFRHKTLCIVSFYWFIKFIKLVN